MYWRKIRMEAEGRVQPGLFRFKNAFVLLIPDDCYFSLSLFAGDASKMPSRFFE